MFALWWDDTKGLLSSLLFPLLEFRSFSSRLISSHPFISFLLIANNQSFHTFCLKFIFPSTWIYFVQIEWWIAIISILIICACLIHFQLKFRPFISFPKKILPICLRFRTAFALLSSFSCSSFHFFLSSLTLYFLLFCHYCLAYFLLGYSKDTAVVSPRLKSST